MFEMTNMYIYVFLGATFLIGFISTLRELLNYQKKLDFAFEYSKKLKDYIDSEGKDYTSYAWLTSKSYKIQSQMGVFGLIDYQPAGANYIHKNRTFIVNGLPDLRKYYSDFYVFERFANDTAASLMEILIRYMGYLKDKLEASKANLLNPIIIFREGVRFILSFPLNLLSWFGVVSIKSIYSLKNNPIFKIINGLVAIITFLSAIMTLVLGWDNFIKLISNFLAKFFI